MSTQVLRSPVTGGAATAPAPAPMMDVPTIRHSPDRHSVIANLGLLAEFAGSWRGNGFNLIARPDGQNGQNLYLQLNQTMETLQVDPIGSPVPNRAFGKGQPDISLFGLTYLQKISDQFTGSAMHIEPGIWITQPNTTFPPEAAPAGDQLIARMGSIPHGNSLLAQGIAAPFSGPPVLKAPQAQYAGSQFPSFNTTPFVVGTPFNAAGSSEKLSAPAGGFSQYDLANAASAANPRTPFNTNPPDPALPATINGVAMQTVLNDPITLLQATINEQVALGYTFEGTVINISTQASIDFFTTANKNAPTDTKVTVKPLNGAGGIENILFLQGETPTPATIENNAETATVYATFWIERVSHPSFPSFFQLQYAQMVVLDFPIFKLLFPTTGAATPVNLAWPHVSVATLRKTFC